MKIGILSIMFLVVVGFFFYYFYFDDTPENIYMPLDIRVKNAITKYTGTPEGTNCIIYYEPEEIWDLKVFVHFGKKVCLNDTFIIKPSYFKQQTENAGGMKFLVKSINSEGITLVNTENEMFTAQFPSGKYAKLENTELLSLPKYTEKCVIPNISNKSQNKRYCFVYGENGALLLKISDSY